MFWHGSTVGNPAAFFGRQKRLQSNENLATVQAAKQARTRLRGRLLARVVHVPFDGTGHSGIDGFPPTSAVVEYLLKEIFRPTGNEVYVCTAGTACITRREPPVGDIVDNCNVQTSPQLLKIVAHFDVQRRNAVGKYFRAVIDLVRIGDSIQEMNENSHFLTFSYSEASERKRSPDDEI
jgi:hypothetical protein